MRQAAAALAALLAASPLPALAKDIAGVKLADTVTVDGKALQLNGAGLRKKLFIKVYVGALYLPARSSDAAAIVAADEPKHVRMVFVRDVDQDSIMGAFRDGFRKNSKGPDLAALEKDLDRIAPAIGNVKERGEITVSYVPGAGTTVTGPKGSVTVAGKPFADALFRNWLGPDVADGDLKKHMLGR